MVSVVMSTFHRHKQLIKTLDSIITQNYKDIEIIVVDDGIDEETPAVCSKYNLKYIKVNRPQSTAFRNPARVNNIGVRQSSGDIVILQNAECMHVDPNTIEKLKNTVTDTSVAFAKVYALNPDGQIVNVYCGRTNPRPFFFCGAIKRFWFEKLRGFDEDFVTAGYDDDDFGDRLRREGVVFNFTDIEVHHQYHTEVVDKNFALNAPMFGRKMSEPTVRNLDREWGAL